MLVEYTFYRCDGTTFSCDTYEDHWSGMNPYIMRDYDYIIEMLDSENCYKVDVVQSVYDAPTDYDEVTFEWTYYYTDFICSRCGTYDGGCEHPAGWLCNTCKQDMSYKWRD